MTGCVSESAPPGPRIGAGGMENAAFVMRDGARLPYRTWLPQGAPSAVVLALHGFNDSRDAWDIPGPDFAAAGIALYAPDQRGFGEAPGRGLWPGDQALVDDAAEMVALLRAAHPNTRFVVMGESMGGAVAMSLATSPEAPADVGYVLIAPAVWGRARMNLVYRGTLWLAATLVPGMILTRPPAVVRVIPSDNHEALLALARDPLTIKSTRVDTLKGLVDLMDRALAAAPALTASSLLLYGAHDDLVPPAATTATWRALPTEATRTAFYPNGYHLLLRDLGRAAPIGDTIAWIANPNAPLPTSADKLATHWLENRTTA